MSDPILSKDAERDFADILAFTADRRSVAQARRYGEALIACMRALADGAAQRRRVTVGGETYWRLRCRHHRLFAIERDEAIVIVAILHAAMELGSQLSKRRDTA